MEQVYLGRFGVKQQGFKDAAIHIDWSDRRCHPKDWSDDEAKPWLHQSLGDSAQPLGHLEG